MVSGPFAATPTVYAVPRDAEDLSRLLAVSRGEGLPIIPRGAGTGMPGGNLGPWIVVDLATPFSTIHPPDGHRIRVGAGALAGQVDATARRAGLHLPPLPSSARWCSVGGMAAVNAAGARSFGHGAIASWVVGLEGMDVEGRPFRWESDRGESDRWGSDRWESGDRETGDGGSGPDGGRVLDGADPGPALRRAVTRALDPGDRAGAGPDAGSRSGSDGGPDAEPQASPDGRRGHRISGWPQLRKNASGYALDRYLASGDPVQLLVGSEGTLALLTGVTLRLAPLPAFRGVHVLPVDSPDAVTVAALAAPETGAVACEFLGRRFLEVAGLDGHPRMGTLARDAWALLLLDFEGGREEVEAGLAAARALGRNLSGEGRGTTDPHGYRDLWALRHAASPVIAERAREGLFSTQFIEDSVVPPHHLGHYLQGLEEILARHRFDAVVFGHAGDGNVHVNPLVDVGAPDWLPRVRRTLDEVVELVALLGGTLTGEHGDGRLRAPFLNRIWGDPATSAFRRVKAHFDPDGLLNPGVILPLEGQDPLAGLRPRARSWPG
jgi:FAD/FMN-containing dehydrogenase